MVGWMCYILNIDNKAASDWLDLLCQDTDRINHVHTTLKYRVISESTESDNILRMGHDVEKRAQK